MSSFSHELFLFYKNISRTPAVSSTNFGSILTFASGVVGTCNILLGEFFHNGRGHIVLLKTNTYIYYRLHIL